MPRGAMVLSALNHRSLPVKLTLKFRHWIKFYQLPSFFLRSLLSFSDGLVRKKTHPSKENSGSSKCEHERLLSWPNQLLNCKFPKTVLTVLKKITVHVCTFLNWHSRLDRVPIRKWGILRKGLLKHHHLVHKLVYIYYYYK